MEFIYELMSGSGVIVTGIGSGAKLVTIAALHTEFADTNKYT
jgi:hypothetical protein